MSTQVLHGRHHGGVHAFSHAGTHVDRALLYHRFSSNLQVSSIPSRPSSTASRLPPHRPAVLDRAKTSSHITGISTDPHAVDSDSIGGDDAACAPPSLDSGEYEPAVKALADRLHARTKTCDFENHLDVVELWRNVLTQGASGSGHRIHLELDAAAEPHSELSSYADIAVYAPPAGFPAGVRSMNALVQLVSSSTSSSSSPSPTSSSSTLSPSSSPLAGARSSWRPTYRHCQNWLDRHHRDRAWRRGGEPDARGRLRATPCWLVAVAGSRVAIFAAATGTGRAHNLRCYNGSDDDDGDDEEICVLDTTSWLDCYRLAWWVCQLAHSKVPHTHQPEWELVEAGAEESPYSAEAQKAARRRSATAAEDDERRGRRRTASPAIASLGCACHGLGESSTPCPGPSALARVRRAGVRKAEFAGKAA